MSNSNRLKVHYANRCQRCRRVSYRGSSARKCNLVVQRSASDPGKICAALYARFPVLSARRSRCTSGGLMDFWSLKRRCHDRNRKHMASSLLAAVLAMDNTDQAVLVHIIEPNECRTRRDFIARSDIVIAAMRRAAVYDSIDLSQARYRCVVTILRGNAEAGEFDFPAHYLLQPRVRDEWIRCIYDGVLTLRRQKKGQFRVEIAIEQRRKK